MLKRQQDPGGYLIGDKVRVRSGEHKGKRGVIQSEEIGLVEVELDTGEVLNLTALEVTNYSLAARRAWQSIPKKAGRPRSDQAKKMVSVRLDQDVIAMLNSAVGKGLFSSKSEVVNTLLRENLKRVFEEVKKRRSEVYN